MEEYSQGVVDGIDGREVAVLKNGLPMSIDDITDDFEQLQAENKRLRDAIEEAMMHLSTNYDSDGNRMDDSDAYECLDKALKEGER